MKLKITLVITLITAIAAVSVIGINSLLTAQTNPPGSSVDPLVTKSYVDGKFDELLREINLLKTQNRVFLEEISNLKKQVAALTTTPASTTTSGTVTAQTLNMRSGPGTNHAIVTTLSSGTQFTLLKREGVWLQIRLKDGRTGWVHSGFVKLSS